jgi:predicted AAA+ superfamily ATPase
MNTFVERRINKKLLSLVSSFPIVALTGCRQCGKSTLLKNLFPHWKYVSLEDIDIRELAENDPRYFLSLYPEQTIFDEIQRVPKLFSYIQTHVDSLDKTGIYILSGSQNFLLMKSISQSLAGRTAVLNLATFSISELKQADLLITKLDECLFTGFYPRIYNQKPLPYDFYQSYIKTYIERDVRELKNITDLSAFHKFLRLCAGRVGQILNTTELANETGISVLTVKSWLSVLETSGIIFLLKPYYSNYGKRLIKSPKLYFYDTGLICSLIGLQNSTQLELHFLRGSIFENLVISNYIKESYFKGVEPSAYYWRDSNGLEVDLVIEENQQLKLYEIKSSATMNEKFFSSINKLCILSKTPLKNANVVYGGNTTLNANNNHGGYISWMDL